MEQYRIITETHYQKVISLLEEEKISQALTLLKRNAFDLIETKEALKLELNQLTSEIMESLILTNKAGISPDQKSKLNTKIGTLQRRLAEVEQRAKAFNNTQY